MRVHYKVFRGIFKSWQKLFDDAAQFATEIGRERLITIATSADQAEGVVTVWYWE